MIKDDSKGKGKTKSKTKTKTKTKQAKGKSTEGLEIGGEEWNEESFIEQPPNSPQLEEEEFQAGTARFDLEESGDSDEEQSQSEQALGVTMQSEVCLVQEDNPQPFALGDSGSSHVMSD